MWHAGKAMVMMLDLDGHKSGAFVHLDPGNTVKVCLMRYAHATEEVCLPVW